MIHHLHMYQVHLAAPVATAWGIPTDRERKCCGQGPNLGMVIQLPHLTHYCIDNRYLRLHRRYRVDVLVVADAAEPVDDAREYQHPAYTEFVMWQHGALGTGN